MADKKKRALPGLDLVAADMAGVEETLDQEVRSDVKLVIEVSRHILGSGGKRFRPLLALLSGRVAGLRRKKELYAYAAGMELAHTSTLLHDDVIDEADLRRGETSANRLFGNPPSIIVGDYLLFKSFQLLLRGNRLAVVKYMTDVAVEMAEGEAYQLAQKSRPDLTEAEYEKIIRAKTALLIQASCQIPAIAADAGKKMENILGGYAYQLGLAFQITDDALDYGATDAGWGKRLGKDFMEGKTTLPLIIAHQNGGRAQRALIHELFKKEDKGHGDYLRLMEVMADTGAIPESRARAREAVAKAKKTLRRAPDSKARKALLDLADFVADRSV